MAETIPGGYFLGPDGEPHDANGNKIPKRSDADLAKAKGDVAGQTPEQREAGARQRAAEVAADEAKVAAEQAAALAKSAALEAKAVDQAAPKVKRAKKAKAKK